MSLNWKEIDAVLGELDLVGSHIQRVIQPDFRNLIFDVYGTQGSIPVRVVLETGKTRMHRALSVPSKPAKRQRFAQFLHARVKGGKIVRAEQVGADRVVRIDVVRAGEATILWIRLWGGAANLIATDETGTILDAFFRRPARGEVSKGHFFIGPDEATDESRRARLDSFSSRFVRISDATGTGPGSVNHQVAELYAGLESEQAKSGLSEKAARLLDRRENRVRSRLADLERDTQDDEGSSAEQLRLSGDLILANLHRIKDGAEWLEADDYTREGRLAVIELNPALSPQENARRYYEKAKKRDRSLTARSEERENLVAQLSEIEQTRNHMEGWDRSELEGFLARNAPAARAESVSVPTPGLEFRSGEYRILVGRSAKENDELMRRHIKGNDVWLHTRDYPGGYVFIKAQKGKSVPLDVLLDGGNLAVHFSRARNSGKAELYYTFAKYLRRAKDGPVGLVLPTQEKNLSISVDPDRLKRLLARARAD